MNAPDQKQKGEIAVKDLHNVETDWRPAPFWALNDRLENGELRRQIDEFARGGMGGFFMHARSGLLTPYLSRQFMDNIAACADEAEKLGMHAWIYDENGWPSGTAGGMITNQSKDNLAKALVCCECGDDAPLAGEIYRCGHEGRTLAFRVVYGEGEDVLDPAAIGDFIGITHEAYFEKFGDRIPSVIPGTFFDEPQYATYYDRNDYIPWGAGLEDKFRSMWGYDIKPHLPDIFFDLPGSRRTRTHFYKTATQMFAESFTKQITDWCEARGMISTGHLEWEQELYAQIRCTGSVMRHYEYETWPGTDQLGSYMAYPWINRQAASVTSQLGKGRTMVECFGVAGENFSLGSRRWLYGIMLALGSDFFVPHISLYSMKTGNKRDHPPFNLHQQPWWGMNKPLEDEISRAVGAMTQGRRLTSVLLLNPIVNAWGEYRPGEHSYIDGLQTKYEELNYSLLKANIIYDIGEENIMEGNASAGGGVLRVGSAEYDAVILLDHRNMLASTARLLDRFSAGGGRICVLGAPPEYEEGDHTQRLSELPYDTAEDAVEWVRRNVHQKYGVETLLGEVWSQIREAEGKHLWFVTNYDASEPAVFSVCGADCVGRVDLDTGDIYACGRTVTLAPGEFAVIAEGVYPEPETAPWEGLTAEKLSGPWKLSSRAHTSGYANCANLDMCTFAENGETLGPMHTRAAYEKIAASDRRARRSVALEFEFENGSGCKGFALAMESPEDCIVQVNGSRVCPDGGWFVDRVFRTLDISEAVIPGRNRIRVTAHGWSKTSLEDLYLLGDFAVSTDKSGLRILSDLPKTTDGVSLEKNGYPFFAGELTLEKTVKLERAPGRAAIRVEPADGTIVKVSLNGQEQGTAWAAPWEVPLVGLREGDNTLRLTLVNTLRNLLGPLHTTKPEWRGAGPADFGRTENWTDDVVLVPYGLKSAEIIK